MDQASPIGKNTCLLINSNIPSASKDSSLRDNIPSWSCKEPRWCLGLDCVNCQYIAFNVQPCVSKNLDNCALTSHRGNCSQGFLGSSVWVIILKFGSNKIFLSFIEGSAGAGGGKCPQHTREVLGQGSNSWRCSGDLSHSSDNTGSLTHYATREPLHFFLRLPNQFFINTTLKIKQMLIWNLWLVSEFLYNYTFLLNTKKSQIKLERRPLKDGVT